MANFSATQIGGLSSAMLLLMATNAAFELLRATAAAVRLSEGGCCVQPTGAILARKVYAAQPKYCDKPLSMGLAREILVICPLEVVPLGGHCQRHLLAPLGVHVTRRRQHDGTPFGTEQGTLILDCAFGAILQAAELAVKLNARLGIVEHGLCIGLVTEVSIAGVAGIRHLTSQRATLQPLYRDLERVSPQ